jgi:hypothetical protein
MMKPPPNSVSQARPSYKKLGIWDLTNENFLLITGEDLNEYGAKVCIDAISPTG